MRFGLLAAALLIAACASTARAQVVVQTQTVLRPVTTYYAPVVTNRVVLPSTPSSVYVPATTYVPTTTLRPVTTYYAPTTTYYAPTTTYYAPTTTYYAPTTTVVPRAAVVPTTTYYVPARRRLFRRPVIVAPVAPVVYYGP